MGIVTLDIRDGITPELERLIKKSRNLRPAMRKIELLVNRPLRSRAFKSSGIKSHTGRLRDTVETWHGRKSAGISVHAKGLDFAKAATLARGAKRHSFRKRRKYVSIRGHNRGRSQVKAHERRNAGSPWGNIKARPFIPTRLSAGDVQRVVSIIKDHLDG